MVKSRIRHDNYVNLENVMDYSVTLNVMRRSVELLAFSNFDFKKERARGYIEGFAGEGSGVHVEDFGGLKCLYINVGGNGDRYLYVGRYRENFSVDEPFGCGVVVPKYGEADVKLRDWGAGKRSLKNRYLKKSFRVV